MTYWCLDHPWLTFWLILFSLLTIDGLISNFFRYKLTKLNQEKPSLNREEIEEQYKKFYSIDKKI